ncbi:MSMEG_0570 family nitrogen starvation response protein [Synechococcus sp. PCC 7336]|uniref:MSMEG_0570 family nitrogen starvation response protein n=1 Tax=Synechococcus sp. PCC 7336 TaxID=195250 RepID=UPI000347A8B2|nr:MSMEG_0570 family nitrogen starvation response protein [Synechococcus sp. PCC 7336]
MPEMQFKVEWPDSEQEIYYSPSLVIKDYFSLMTDYSVDEFLERSRSALTIASDRVRAKYGFPCGRALGELRRIEGACDRCSDRANGTVRIIQFIE